MANIQKCSWAYRLHICMSSCVASLAVSMEGRAVLGIVDKHISLYILYITLIHSTSGEIKTFTEPHQ